MKDKHLAPGSDYLLSLSSVMGKKVADLQGYVCREFGDDTPVFHIAKVVFDDGTDYWIEGEHDNAYIPSQDDGPLSQENLDLIDPPDDEDDDEDDDERDGFDPDSLDDENDEERRMNRY
jgi:hypothetical protein